MSHIDYLAKLYGEIEATNDEGKRVVMVYDYAQQKARPKDTMTAKERIESELARRGKTDGDTD